MRILVVSQYFPPDITAAAFRVGYTVQYLARNGHEVRVLTALPHKAKGYLEGADMEVPKNCSVYRSKLADIGRGGFARYLRHYLSFVAGSALNGIRLYLKGWRPQIIWATSPPLFTGISSFALSKLFRCPFVFDIRDIWPESAVSAGQISASGMAFRFGKILEMKLYSAASHMTCVSGAMGEYLRQSSSTPVTAVYNGISPNGRLKPGRVSPQKKIMYAGNFGLVQGLETLIEGLADLKDAEYLHGWKVVLIGAGADEERLRSLISSLHLKDSISILPPMPREAVIEEMRSAGILFMNLKGDKVFELTIPSKVFDYMLTGRPILAGILGEGKTILETSGANICFEPNNKDSFKTALKEMTSKLSLFEKKGQKNSKLVLSNYTREKGLMALNRVLAGVLRETESL